MKAKEELSHLTPRRARSWTFLRPAAAGVGGQLSVTNDSQCQLRSISVSPYSILQKREPAWPETDILSCLTSSERRLGHMDPEHPQVSEARTKRARQQSQAVSITINFFSPLISEQETQGYREITKAVSGKPGFLIILFQSLLSTAPRLSLVLQTPNIPPKVVLQ